MKKIYTSSFSYNHNGSKSFGYAAASTGFAGTPFSAHSRSFRLIFFRRRSMTASSDLTEWYVFLSSFKLFWIREIRSEESMVGSEMRGQNTDFEKRHLTLININLSLKSYYYSKLHQKRKKYFQMIKTVLRNLLSY